MPRRKAQPPRPKPDPQHCYLSHGVIQVIDETQERPIRQMKCFGCTLVKTYSIRWFHKRGITDPRQINQEIEKRFEALKREVSTRS
jgi:hypothetical protein